MAVRLAAPVTSPHELCAARDAHLQVGASPITASSRMPPLASRECKRVCAARKNFARAENAKPSVVGSSTREDFFLYERVTEASQKQRRMACETRKGSAIEAAARRSLHALRSNARIGATCAFAFLFFVSAGGTVVLE